MEFAVATMVKMGPVMPQTSARPKEEVPKDHVHQDTDHAAFVRGKINLEIKVKVVLGFTLGKQKNIRSKKLDDVLR